MAQVELKLIETDSEFLDVSANKLFVNNEEWFFFPYWFKKVGEGLFAQYRTDEVPKYVKDFLTEELNNGTK